MGSSCCIHPATHTKQACRKAVYMGLKHTRFGSGSAACKLTIQGPALSFINNAVVLVDFATHVPGWVGVVSCWL